jgi:hypothetical protein
MNNKPEYADSAVSEDLEEVLGEELSTEDVGGEEASPNLAEINRITGRDFDSLEDFEKHYQNLNSLVGDQKRIENEKKARELEKIKGSGDQQLRSIVEGLQSQLVEKDFLAENPSAKSSLDLVKAVAQSKSLTLQEAWDNHIKDTWEKASAYNEEKEIGIRSKQRILPTEAKEIKSLVEKVTKSSNTEDKEALVSKWLNL